MYFIKIFKPNHIKALHHLKFLNPILRLLHVNLEYTLFGAGP